MSPAVPKPAAREKAPRKPLKRSSPPKARKPIAKSTKPLKKAGETKRKKVIKQNAYYASAVWKAKRKSALERAGNRCEMTGTRLQFNSYGALTGFPIRCGVTEHLHIHHRSNARFGGDELPEDLQVLCKEHHDLVETRDFPHRQRNR